MRKDIRRRYEAHVRANHVCTEHSTILDSAPGGRSVRTAFATHVTAVSRLLADQERCVQDRLEATAQCRRARAELRDAIRLIVRLGTLVGRDADVMGGLQLPGPMSDSELLAYAGGMLRYVAPHAETFQAAGVPEDLLTNLADRMHALDDARAQQGLARQRFAEAAVSIRELQRLCDTAVAALDAIALYTRAARPELLTLLRVAKRVGPRVRTAEKPVAQHSEPVPIEAIHPTVVPAPPAEQVARVRIAIRWRDVIHRVVEAPRQIPRWIRWRALPPGPVEQALGQEEPIDAGIHLSWIPNRSPATQDGSA